MSDALTRAREASQGFRTQADVSLMFDTYAALLDVAEAAQRMHPPPRTKAEGTCYMCRTLATLEARIEEETDE